MNQCSEIFADVFDSHCGRLVRQCACGRTFFNYMDAGYFEAGEMEHLEKQSHVNPDKFFAVDHAIGTMLVGGQEIVNGCHCETAKRYERFILAHAEQLAEYLRRHAAALRERATLVDVPNVAEIRS